MAVLWLDRIDQLVDEAVDRGMRRERLFRDRNNPLDSLDDLQLYQRFRLNRQGIYELTDMFDVDLRRATNRSMALPSTLQVLLLFITL
jgi:hypothetical protein